MPKAEEEKAIRAIQAEYNVDEERARAIYFGHKENLKKRRGLHFKKRGES